MSYNFSLRVVQHGDITASLFLGIQFGTGVQDGGWRGRGTWLPGSRAQASCTVNSKVFALQVVSLFFWYIVTSAWDMFFPTTRSKFNSQYSYYSNGVRHAGLISALAFFENFADYVSCCVQNSHLLNKTVSTSVHPPPGNHNCQFSNQNTPALLSFFLLEKPYLAPVLINRFSATLLLGSVTHFNQTFRTE